MTEYSSATEELRAWEDRHLGADTPRVGGVIEKGHGSAYDDLDDTHKAEHTALEELVVAEADLAAAQSDLAAAQAKYDAARAASSDPEDVQPPADAPVAAMASAEPEADADEEDSHGGRQHGRRRSR